MYNVISESTKHIEPEPLKWPGPSAAVFVTKQEEMTATVTKTLV